MWLLNLAPPPHIDAAVNRPLLLPEDSLQARIQNPDGSRDLAERGRAENKGRLAGGDQSEEGSGLEASQTFCSTFKWK